MIRNQRDKHRVQQVVFVLVMGMFPAMMMASCNPNANFNAAGKYQLTTKMTQTVETTYNSQPPISKDIPLEKDKMGSLLLTVGSYDPMTHGMKDIAFQDALIPSILLNDQRVGSTAPMPIVTTIDGFPGCQRESSFTIKTSFPDANRIDLTVSLFVSYTTIDNTLKTCEDMLNQMSLDINRVPLPMPFNYAQQAGELDLAKIKTLRSIKVTVNASGMRI